MIEIIEKVRMELREASDEKTRQTGLRFFKEEINLYGVRSRTVKDIAQQNHSLVKGRSKRDILAMCDSLWKSGIMEETFVACLWTEKLGKDFTPEDFSTLEEWVHRYVNNWASCDTLCNHTIGDFIQKYPDYLAKLKSWAGSENRWVKRAATVSLIIPARRGKFLSDIFDIAKILLLDKDDMVQKGYGWMLKEASKPHQKEVFDFVMQHKAFMPRTALRYAIEKMPVQLREEAMTK